MSLQHFLTCILNADDVEKIIKTPGRRYLGPKGTEMAAIKIQVGGSCLDDVTQSCIQLHYLLVAAKVNCYEINTFNSNTGKAWVNVIIGTGPGGNCSLIIS